MKKKNSIILSDFLEYIRPISWAEIFENWEKDESSQQMWLDLAKKNRYFSWKEWRESFFAPLGLQKKKWIFYKVNNPLKIIPHMYCGEFSAWKQFYTKREDATFEKISTHPVFSQNEKILSLVHNFPKKTMLIGTKEQENIAIFEGNHRATALATAARENIDITSDVFLSVDGTLV